MTEIGGSIMPRKEGPSSLLEIAVFLDGAAFAKSYQYFQVLMNLDLSFSTSYRS
ncbi:hypothetical protein [Burkholderia ubonensis]|uniref:hypothetical protein n=1 Tax=Burkholderia ubonensis TaxID=101571 RepID=UPI000A620B04|nr:hypothetical protein [Burkholderia ubonensis]